MDMLQLIYEAFDMNDMSDILEDNEKWKDKTEKESEIIRAFRNKLNELDLNLLIEFEKINNLKDGILALEDEIYFTEGFKQGILFMSKLI